MKKNTKKSHIDYVEDCPTNFREAIPLLLQYAMIFGGIGFSLPAVLWGVVLPCSMLRYSYEKDLMSVSNFHAGRSAPHDFPTASGLLQHSGITAVVGLKSRTKVKVGDSIYVYVREDGSPAKASDVSWILGRSLRCLSEEDMDNRWKYAAYAWTIYWPSLFYFVWLGIFKKKGIIRLLIA